MTDWFRFNNSEWFQTLLLLKDYPDPPLSKKINKQFSDNRNKRQFHEIAIEYIFSSAAN